MEFIQAEIPMNCRIFDTGDWHIGPNCCDMNAIKSLINEIKEAPNARVVLKGDLIDAISTDDKRFSPMSADIKDRWRVIDDHVDYLIELLNPIKNKIICSLYGNHELTLIKQTDITKRICKALDIPCGGYVCVVTFTNKARKKHLFQFFLTHGRKSITSNAKDPLQKKANMQARVKDILASSEIESAVYMSMGHAHKIITVPPTIYDEPILVVGNNKLQDRQKTEIKQNHSEIPTDARWYVCSGSFLKTYSAPGMLSYSELAQYGPVKLGCVEVVVSDGEIIEVKERRF